MIYSFIIIFTYWKGWQLAIRTATSPAPAIARIVIVSIISRTPKTASRLRKSLISFMTAKFIMKLTQMEFAIRPVSSDLSAGNPNATISIIASSSSAARLWIRNGARSLAGLTRSPCSNRWRRNMTSARRTWSVSPSCKSAISNYNVKINFLAFLI